MDAGVAGQMEAAPAYAEAAIACHSQRVWALGPAGPCASAGRASRVAGCAGVWIPSCEGGCRSRCRSVSDRCGPDGPAVAAPSPETCGSKMPATRPIVPLGSAAGAR
jgi:hypothetical protein